MNQQLHRVRGNDKKLFLKLNVNVNVIQEDGIRPGEPTNKYSVRMIIFTVEKQGAGRDKPI